MDSFRNELANLINKYSLENGSNTPDFILAEYMEACLHAYDEAAKSRDKWYGMKPSPFNVSNRHKEEE